MKRIYLLFFLFFITGIVITLIWSKQGFSTFYNLSAEEIENVKQTKWDVGSLLIQCVVKRLGIIILIFMASGTKFGKRVNDFYIIWFSLSMGVLMEDMILQFGIIGLFLVIIGIFPQYLFYIPAYLTLVKEFIINCNIRGMKSLYPNRIGGRKIWFVIGVVIIGILLESYVNPFILKKYINLFF